MASPLLAGVTILILGDSHFATRGYLVSTLQDALIQQGATVVTEAACGAPASVWVSSLHAPCGTAERIGSGALTRNLANEAPVQPLEALIARFHPSLIIVGSGDTMGGYAQASFPAQWAGEQITLLTRRIQAANLPCLWIGPGWGTEGGPYFKTYARVQVANEFLSTHVAPCRYIDSLEMAKPGEWATFDGQHYTTVGYAKWGRAIDEAITKLAETR